ncbi:hypothetical protein JOF46_003975 [Paeniglutamicibacter psychrophenolicus]|uniref:Uncharacterized protein n=2 Tax=Paeniglutamicibacter psychrophenolicus TaxID=257454 RepID=A0ABS4WIQ3_9MICC|nr:hypothetical protein [Paeniglutamicibacter psychrophenolicus]
MIITLWGSDVACSVSSPQLPGIVAAYDEQPGPLELHTLAVTAGLNPGGTFDVHVECAIEVDDVTYFVRSRSDYYSRQRAKVAESIATAVRNNAGLRKYADADDLDDVLFIAALPSDRIKDVMATRSEGQPLTVGMVDDQGVWSFVGLSSGNDETGRRSMSDFGLGPESTVGDLFDRIEGKENGPLVDRARVREHLLVSA